MVGIQGKMVDVDGWTVPSVQLTKNIWSHELRIYYPKQVPDHARLPVLLSQLVIDDVLMDIAEDYQKIRDCFGKPIRFWGVVRPMWIKRWIKRAAPDSRHDTKWLSDGIVACDYSIDGVPFKDVYDATNELMNVGTIAQGGLGLYSDHVHRDNRGRKARW